MDLVSMYGFLPESIVIMLGLQNSHYLTPLFLLHALAGTLL